MQKATLRQKASPVFCCLNLYKCTNSTCFSLSFSPLSHSFLAFLVHLLQMSTLPSGKSPPCWSRTRTSRTTGTTSSSKPSAPSKTTTWTSMWAKSSRRICPEWTTGNAWQVFPRMCSEGNKHDAVVFFKLLGNLSFSRCSEITAAGEGTCGVNTSHTGLKNLQVYNVLFLVAPRQIVMSIWWSDIWPFYWKKKKETFYFHTELSLTHLTLWYNEDRYQTLQKEKLARGNSQDSRFF